ncbi:MAG: GIY-YIG nuclease family protein [Thermosphaera sp.]
MSSIESIFDDKGCYILALRVTKNHHVSTRRRQFIIDEGVYFYVGSARGSGGVKARVFRHLFPKAKRFWHIDYLLQEDVAKIAGFYVLNDNPPVDCEAELSRIMLSHFKPVPGFGCSDKRKDYSHLFKCLGSLKECLSRLYSVLTANHMEPLWIQNI